MYVVVREAPNPSKIEPCVNQGVPKRVLWHPMGVPNEHLGHPRGSKRGPWLTQGVPKSIRMALGTPLDHKADPRRKRDLEPNSKDQPFCPPLGRPWALQGSIVDPSGVPKLPKTRHGEARSAPLGAKVGQKSLQKGVPKWDRKSD